MDLADIDPVFFEKTYYAIPRSSEAARPYLLLHAAMREAGRAGIGRFVLRTKPHLVAIRPMHDVLAVETLFFGDEVRDPAALVPGLQGAQVEERELALATRLIEMLKTEWDPTAYADTYREDLLRVLAEKAPTPTVLAAAHEPTAAGSSAVERLMIALKESVEAAKQSRAGDRARRRPGSRPDEIAAKEGAHLLLLGRRDDRRRFAAGIVGSLGRSSHVCSAWNSVRTPRTQV